MEGIASKPNNNKAIRGEEFSFFLLYACRTCCSFGVLLNYYFPLSLFVLTFILHQNTNHCPRPPAAISLT